MSVCAAIPAMQLVAHLGASGDTLQRVPLYGQPDCMTLCALQHDTAPLSDAEIEARAIRALALRKARADAAAALKATAQPMPATAGQLDKNVTATCTLAATPQSDIINKR